MQARRLRGGTGGRGPRGRGGLKVSKFRLSGGELKLDGASWLATRRVLVRLEQQVVGSGNCGEVASQVGERQLEKGKRNKDKTENVVEVKEKRRKEKKRQEKEDG